MKKTLHYSTLLLLSWCLSLAGLQQARASHAQAGQVSYRYISTAANGEQTYQVRVDFFRDCSGIPLPTSLPLRATNTCNGAARTATLTSMGPPIVGAPYCASIQALANSIRTYFHHTEGRGNNCVVEPFRRGDLDYFFAYPEDYSQQSPEWVNGQFDIRPHNPAFEVIFVYSQSEGSLDLNYRGSYKAIEPLQAMFAETILQALFLYQVVEEEEFHEC